MMKMIFILGQRNGLYVPCIFAITTSKKKRTYGEIFQALMTAAENLELLPNPSLIVSDFEMAAISSAVKAFPHARIQGCYFHFAQSIFRAIQRCGLQATYATNMTASLKLKMIFSLAFLPEEDIGLVYSQLMISEHFFAAPDENVKNLLEYLEKTWVGQQVRGGEGSQRTSPRFRYSLWSVYKSILDDHSRTNNSVEAWHNAINRCIVSGPTIFKFIDFLKKRKLNAVFVFQSL